MQEILYKFKSGDPISDAELEVLIKHYSVLIENLQPHGEIFQLVTNVCYHDLETLTRFKIARSRR